MCNGNPPEISWRLPVVFSQQWTRRLSQPPVRALNQFIGWRGKLLANDVREGMGGSTSDGLKNTSMNWPKC